MSMSFQWLNMRITEEQDRRQREAQILERLPQVLNELHDALAACLAEYTSAFGAESAEITHQPNRVHISVREEQDGKWQQISKVDITTVVSVPGFQIERGTEPL